MRRKFRSPTNRRGSISMDAGATLKLGPDIFPEAKIEGFLVTFKQLETTTQAAEHEF